MPFLSTACDIASKGFGWLPGPCQQGKNLWENVQLSGLQLTLPEPSPAAPTKGGLKPSQLYAGNTHSHMGKKGAAGKAGTWRQQDLCQGLI